jgi:SAM-dependent methyltransferase
MTDWDIRYAEEEYAYGTEPNGFLAAVACQIPEGPVLCLAEGQGRNAAFLAGRGYRVTAVDQSRVGMARAAELAAARGVNVECVTADLAAYDIGVGRWAGIVSIFVHLPAGLRADVYRRAVAGLRPGGIFVLEAYAPRQLEFGTGGPRDLERLAPRATLQEHLAGLEFLLAQDAEREVVEGRHHRGMAAVVQLLGRKPGDPAGVVR